MEYRKFNIVKVGTITNHEEENNGYFDTIEYVKKAIDLHYKEKNMISKDFNWLIVNIDTQEKWDKVVDKIYDIDSSFLRLSKERWYDSYHNYYNNVGYTIEQNHVTHSWDKEAIKKDNPKIIECDDFLGSEKPEEKTYTGKEIWQALLDGKTLTSTCYKEGEFIYMDKQGIIKDEDGVPVSVEDDTHLKYTEYKEPTLTHEELEEKLGFKFKYTE